MIFPPSPALSACDSMGGIDDLDAFLAAQGRLSHFPTPPLKTDTHEQTIELAAEDCDLFPDTSQDLILGDPIANAFAHVASLGRVPAPQDEITIHHILVRANLPLEVIAIAFAMLSSIETGSRTLSGCSSDLLVLAALSLAVSYTDDHAPLPSWYSDHVSKHAYTAQRIDQMALRLLTSLGWHIYKFATPEAYAQAMTSFYTFAAVHAIQKVERSNPIAPPALKTVLPRGPPARCERGSLRPDDTPPALASEETVACAPFLPLL